MMKIKIKANGHTIFEIDAKNILPLLAYHGTGVKSFMRITPGTHMEVTAETNILMIKDQWIEEILPDEGD